MHGGQRRQNVVGLGRPTQNRAAPIVLGYLAHKESQCLQPIDKARRAVGLEKQPFGNVTDRRLIAAAGGAYAISVLLMRRSIVTEKITRRGQRILQEYTVDPLDLL